MAGRLIAAVQTADTSTLHELLGSTLPLPAIVATLASAAELTSADRHRPFSLLVQLRRDEVLALWHGEPDRRIGRAELFARLGSPFLLERHAQGDAAEQRHAEAVAAALRPYEREWNDLLREPRRDGDQRQRSAEALQRAVARASRAAPHPDCGALRCLEPGPEGLPALRRAMNDITPLRAFDLAGLLAEGNAVVRTRAMVTLRRRLGQPLPTWLRLALAQDPSPEIRRTALEVSDAMIEPVIEALLRDEVSPPDLDLRNACHLTAEHREQLAGALLRAGLRVPFDPLPPEDPRSERSSLWRLSPYDLRASDHFQAVVHLGVRPAAAVLGIAVNTRDPRVARRAMSAVASVAARQEWGTWTVSREMVAAIAPLISHLLEHSDPGVAEGAAWLAGYVLASEPEPGLQEKVVGLALAALGRGAAIEAAPSPGSDCGGGPPPPAEPGSWSASVVHTACMSGDLRLADDLLRRLDRHRSGDDPELVMQCVARLAPHLDVHRARQLHQRLQHGYARWATHHWRPSRPVVHAMYGLFAAVPADLLAWYENELADPGREHECATQLVLARATVPADRLRRFIQPLTDPWRSPRTPELRLQAPEALADAWRAGGDARLCAALVLTGCWQRRRFEILKLCEQGQLPPALLVASLLSPDCPAFDLPYLARALRDPADALGGLGQTISDAPGTTAESDLLALRELSRVDDSAVALAIVSRSLELGAAGRALAMATLKRMSLPEHPIHLGAMLQAAMQLGIELPDHDSVIARLRQSRDADAIVIAKAGDLRRSGLDAVAMQDRDLARTLTLSRLDVDIDSLRRSLRAQHSGFLERLLMEGSPAVKVNGLLLAAEAPAWGKQLEERVMASTTDADASVRRAAYTALATRDQELWECAWLVCEARFDPDARVREVCR